MTVGNKDKNMTKICRKIDEMNCREGVGTVGENVRSGCYDPQEIARFMTKKVGLPFPFQSWEVRQWR